MAREPDDSWRGVFLTDLADVIRVEQLGVALPLAELYAGLDAAAH